MGIKLQGSETSEKPPMEKSEVSFPEKCFEIKTLAFL